MTFNGVFGKTVGDSIAVHSFATSSVTRTGNPCATSAELCESKDSPRPNRRTFSLAAQIYEVIRFHDELAGAIYSGKRTIGFQFFDLHAVDSDGAADGSQPAGVGFGAAIDGKFDFRQRYGDANPIHAEYNDARPAGPDRETADRPREERRIEQPDPLGVSGFF